MKSNSPESAILRSDAGAPDRTRRTLAEATSQFGHAMGEAISGSLNALGGRRQAGSNAARRSSGDSAAVSTQRLREVLERDRALAASQQTAAEQSASLRAQHAAADRAGAREKRGSERPLRVPPPPLPSKKSPQPVSGEASRVASKRSESAKTRGEARRSNEPLVLAADDEDDELSVHDEPTRVGPPPSLAVAEAAVEQTDSPLGKHATASAAAAASAFGAPSSASKAVHAATSTQTTTPARAAEAPVLSEAPVMADKASAQNEQARAQSEAAQSKPTQAPSADGRSADSKPPSAKSAQARHNAASASADEDLTLLPREPIRTLTMARLLASQGHLRRALSIYDELVVKRPDDLALATEVEALRSLKD